MSTSPARRVIEIIRPSRHGPAPRRSHCRPPGWRPRHRAQARARSRARAPVPRRFFCRPASMVSRMTLRARRGRHAPDRPHAAPASASVAAPPARLRLWRRDLVGAAPCRPPPKRSSTRSRAARAAAAKRSGRRSSGDCGSATSSAAFAERQPARLLAEICQRGRADAFEIAAIGREVEIEREDLVLAQRTFDLDGAHDLAQLGQEAALARGSSRRATCMVSVEPPERMCPLVTSWHAARASAPADRRRDARESVCLHRRTGIEEARIDIGDACAGSRQRPSSVA